MRSLRKILRRKSELKDNFHTMLQIQQLLSDHINQSIRLKPASGKSGQDQIYSVLNGRSTVAMVRVENKNRAKPDEPQKWNFRNPLNLHDRIEKEWDSYKKLSAKNLSPEPLWRNDIAMACSRVDSERASRRFIRAKKDFWVLVENIFDAVKEMHDCGITHMDLNLGNILIHPKTNAVSIIDFEFGPAEWLATDQQRACDYLCLLNEFSRKRRGGKIMLSDSERMVGLLDRFIRKDDRDAYLGDILPQLARLSKQEGLCRSLKRVFPNFETRRQGILPPHDNV